MASGVEGQVIECNSVQQWKDQFQKGVDSRKLVVVGFLASWCGPCCSIAPILPEIARRTPHVLFLKVDSDELMAVAEKFQVKALPTFVFLKEGKEVDRVLGTNMKELQNKTLEMASGLEGQVIACHSVQQWKYKFQKGVDSRKLVVVGFLASWCGPCRFIAPILVEIARRTPHVLFLQVDVDELRAVAKKFQVKAMPTFVFFKEGEEVDRFQGADEKELKKIINKIGNFCVLQ